MMAVVFAVLAMITAYVGYVTSMKQSQDGAVGGWILTTIVVFALLCMACNRLR